MLADSRLELFQVVIEVLPHYAAGVLDGLYEIKRCKRMRALSILDMSTYLAGILPISGMTASNDF